MRVIRRAAALAYAFVSINYDQAAAIKYLVRPADGGQAVVRAREVVATERRSWGGSMAKLAWLFVASMSVVAVSGVPTAEAATTATLGALRGMVASIWMTPAALGGSFDGAERWVESGSLLLLATGFFGAAVILRRSRAR
jgi:hypothetical protein